MKEDVTSLLNVLRWPDEMTFPALDILRLALTNSRAQEYLLDDYVLNDLLSLFFVMIKPEMPAACQMLTVRCLVNMFGHEKGKIRTWYLPKGKQNYQPMSFLIFDKNVFFFCNKDFEGH